MSARTVCKHPVIMTCTAAVHVAMPVLVEPTRIKPDEVSAASITNKHISGWDTDENTVSMARRTFDFPSVVLPPDATQAQVYDTLLPPLVAAFVEGGNVNTLCFGQTGSGKTHTMFGPPGSVASASSLQDNHGLFLRCGLDILRGVQALADSGVSAVLTGSMVELHFDILEDLLHDHQRCSIGPAPEYRVRGAREVFVDSEADLFNLARAVEYRTTRGTRMNDTSSRSHCVTVLKLTTLDPGSNRVRTSRFQFFDMMGSERSKGPTSAHDPRQNNKKKLAGMEGIVANMSLSQLAQITSQLIKEQRKARRRGKGVVKPPALRGFPPNLMQMLAGSMGGDAATAMVCTLSQIPLNGNETWNSLTYADALSPLRTLPKKQPSADLHKKVAAVRQRAGACRSASRKLAPSANKYAIIRAQEGIDAAIDLATLEKLAGVAGVDLGAGDPKPKSTSRGDATSKRQSQRRK